MTGIGGCSASMLTVLMRCLGCRTRQIKYFRKYEQLVASRTFEKVLIGTRGARETLLQGAERASGEEQRSDERRKTA